jgi:soluble lytic murein transglycosylase-like protein
VNLGANTQLRGFTTGDPVIDSYIVDSSRHYGIDPLLIYSQMHQESSFKLRATSNKGASGLMQLMPGTARRMGVSDIYDPKQNIEGGVKYMRLLLDMFGGDVNLALAGYNAGEGAVMKFGNQIPPYNETQEYVRRISARYSSISDGSYARTVKRVSSTQAAKLEQKQARPLTVYEPDAVAIRMSDGRMRLVNQ